MPTSTVLSASSFLPMLQVKQALFHTPTLVKSAALRTAAEAYFSALQQHQGGIQDLAVLAYHSETGVDVDDRITSTPPRLRVLATFSRGTVSLAVDPSFDYVQIDIEDDDGGGLAYDYFYDMMDDWVRSTQFYPPTRMRGCVTNIAAQLSYNGTAVGECDISLLVARA